MTDRMLELAIETEGLIRTLKAGRPSAETYALLAKKTAELNALAQEANSHADTSDMVPSEERDMPEETAIIDTPATEIPESALRQEEEADLRMEEAEMEENMAAEQQKETDGCEQEEITTQEDTITIDDDGITGGEDDDILLNLDDEPETAEETAPKPEAHQAEHKPAANLRKAFSLNDRFLYSRELFDGDMKMFDSTLKTLEKVDNFRIAEDYFYNELEWDRDDPTVQAFMERLEAGFK